MSTARLEWKVGLFVLLSLALAAALVVKFSKSTSIFTSTYELSLLTSNVGGIREGATVLMAGVQVGAVRAIELDESGRTVTLHVQIQSRFQIHKDARITIEQAGFLGDQYISITPTTNALPVLRPHDQVHCEEPFNLQEVARSGAGLLHRLELTAAKLNEAVSRVDQTLLSEQTLTNLAVSVANFRVASERALSTLQGVDKLIETNSTPLNTAISNLVEFSTQLDTVTAELQIAVATNRVELTSTMKNLQSGTVYVNSLLAGLQDGRGLAGSLLRDESLRAQFASTLSNLNVVSSNLSLHGLLWKPRSPRARSTTVPIYTGRNPSR